MRMCLIAVRRIPFRAQLIALLLQQHLRGISPMLLIQSLVMKQQKVNEKLLWRCTTSTGKLTLSMLFTVFRGPSATRPAGEKSQTMLNDTMALV